ncbi:uncharacterized protein J3R85_019441 [Psidium guajava]|nr:uncharacterized protein J3R85_019441 [Psidium guajava]
MDRRIWRDTRVEPLIFDGPHGSKSKLALRCVNAHTNNVNEIGPRFKVSCPQLHRGKER